jgi:hypothetical protein
VRNTPAAFVGPLSSDLANTTASGLASALNAVSAFTTTRRAPGASLARLSPLETDGAVFEIDVAPSELSASPRRVPLLPTRQSLCPLNLVLRTGSCTCPKCRAPGGDDPRTNTHYSEPNSLAAGAPEWVTPVVARLHRYCEGMQSLAPKRPFDWQVRFRMLEPRHDPRASRR